jgi:hypothetical protein
MNRRAFFVATLSAIFGRKRFTAWLRTRGADYYSIRWPVHARSWEFGVHCQEALNHYMPFSQAFLTNIAMPITEVTEVRIDGMRLEPGQFSESPGRVLAFPAAAASDDVSISYSYGPIPAGYGKTPRAA